MLTQARVFELVDATLRGDSTVMALLVGGLYQTVAPPSVTLTPFGTYAQQSTLRDIQARGGQVVMGKGLITVKAVAEASKATACKQAADRIDTLLNTLVGATDGATVIRVVRDRELLYDELVKETGVLWTHAGFIYQWWAQ